MIETCLSTARLVKIVYTICFTQSAEAVAQRCRIKKAFLKIWQNLQENNYAGVSFLVKLHTERLFCRTSTNGYFWKYHHNREKSYFLGN